MGFVQTCSTCCALNEEASASLFHWLTVELDELKNIVSGENLWIKETQQN